MTDAASAGDQPAGKRPRPGGTAPLAGVERARVGYGAMQLAEAAHRTDDPVALLRRAVELGVDHIDTAEFYGHGTSNELIRTALHPYPPQLGLATKVAARRGPGGALVPAQRPEELREQVEQNLRSMRCEQLALVNLRRLDRGPGIVAEGAQIVDLDDQLAVLTELRGAGAIAGIGLSTVTAQQLEQALPAGIACVQNNYNVLDRAEESLLEVCRARNVAWVPFFPLGSGFANRRRVTDDETVGTIAAELDVTPAQVGLAWLLAHDAGTLLIPGTTSIAHLQQNFDAGSVELSPDQLAALDLRAGETSPA